MRKLLVPVALVAALLLVPALALGHPERTTFFPDHTKGERPSYPTTGEVHNVCRPESRGLVSKMFPKQRTAKAKIRKGMSKKAKAKARKKARRVARRANRTRTTKLAQVKSCKFSEIQAAVDAATSGDRIQIWPGTYTEETSRKVTFNDPKCALDDPKYWEPTNDGHGENGKVPTYQFHWDCKNSRNLIQIMGDDPGDDDRECDQKCDLLLEGMGKEPGDVRIVGDRVKRDVLRVDRADGIYLRNFTTEQASFNGIDVVETNGFVLQKLVGNYNQNYGVLTFTSDNGLYDEVEGTGNGDSAIYPGSGPEGHCLRYGIEIKNSKSFGNTLGMSGTAGNGTWVHDTKFFNNGTGVVNDSFASGHPGMPQDCSKWENNEVYSNNTNFFEQDNQKYCAGTTFEDRPREHVCPQFQSPVGAGFAFYGANGNIIRNNKVYDNWRSGYRLFWVPGAIRGDNSEAAQRDTSHENKITNNTFGLGPDGKRMPNGVDVFWDEQGDRNCWEDNQGLDGKVTSDPLILPTCKAGGSLGASSRPDKIGREASCATWDPKENPDPPGCDWFKTPPKPDARR